MISKLWLSCVNTSTTEQENRACSEVCWNCWQRERKGGKWQKRDQGKREGRKLCVRKRKEESREREEKSLRCQHKTSQYLPNSFNFIQDSEEDSPLGELLHIYIAHKAEITTTYS